MMCIGGEAFVGVEGIQFWISMERVICAHGVGRKSPCGLGRRQSWKVLKFLIPIQLSLETIELFNRNVSSFTARRGRVGWPEQRRC